MSPFEHIMVTGSIILGLAIAQILTGLADSLRLRGRVISYWPHTLWAIAQLIACIQWGFGVWAFQARPAWAGYELLLFIFTPVVGFLIARLMYPQPLEDVSLKEHYYATKHLTYGLAAFLMLESIVSNSLLLHRHIGITDNIINLFSAFMLIGAALSNSSKYHKVVAPLVLVILIFSALMTGIN